MQTEYLRPTSSIKLRSAQLLLSCPKGPSFIKYKSWQKNATIDARRLKLKTQGLGLTVRLFYWTFTHSLTHSLTLTEKCESWQKYANLDARSLKLKTSGLGLTLVLFWWAPTHSDRKCESGQKNENLYARSLKLKTLGLGLILQLFWWTLTHSLTHSLTVSLTPTEKKQILTKQCESWCLEFEIENLRTGPNCKTILVD